MATKKERRDGECSARLKLAANDLAFIQLASMGHSCALMAFHDRITSSSG
jgi:hypothetical protein